MSNEFALGFVGIFKSELDHTAISEITDIWLKRYQRLEQVCSTQIATMPIVQSSDMTWEKHMQFRVIDGDQFAWIYIGCDTRIIETTGMPNGEKVSLCLELLTDLPGLEKIVSDRDEPALLKLEQQGLL